jgi:hypothetical protein
MSFLDCKIILTANLILELLRARSTPEKNVLIILYHIFHTAQPDS